MGGGRGGGAEEVCVWGGGGVPETLYHRDSALLYIAYTHCLSGLHLSLLTGGTAVCDHS